MKDSVSVSGWVKIFATLEMWKLNLDLWNQNVCGNEKLTNLKKQNFEDILKTFQDSLFQSTISDIFAEWPNAIIYWA